MANFKITKAIGTYIRRAAGAGASHREIAEEVAKKFGTTLDHRSIGRFLSQKPYRASRTAEIADTKAPRATPEAGPVEPLDEIETLERRAVDLNNILRDPSTDPRLVAPLNSELRQTFASIRRAQAAKREIQALASADASWVVAKLKRLDAMNRGEATTDDAQLPEASRPTGSE